MTFTSINHFLQPVVETQQGDLQVWVFSRNCQKNICYLLQKLGSCYSCPDIMPCIFDDPQLSFHPTLWLYQKDSQSHENIVIIFVSPLVFQHSRCSHMIRLKSNLAYPQPTVFETGLEQWLVFIKPLLSWRRHTSRKLSISVSSHVCFINLYIL